MKINTFFIKESKELIMQIVSTINSKTTTIYNNEERYIVAIKKVFEKDRLVSCYNLLNDIAVINVKQILRFKYACQAKDIER